MVMHMLGLKIKYIAEMVTSILLLSSIGFVIAFAAYDINKKEQEAPNE